MKNKTIISFLLAMLSLGAFGQVAIVDSVHHVTVNAYAGTLAGAKFSHETLKAGAFFGFRAGGEIFWTPKRWISFYGLGAGEMDEKGVVTTFSNVRITFIPGEKKKIAIAIGKFATPMTEMRPIPTTGNGQFEPWTKARIPGPGYGGKITYTPKNRYAISAGGFWRDTVASIEAGFKFPLAQAKKVNAHVNGYYLVGEKTGGGAFQLSSEYFSQTLVYTDKYILASLSFFTFPGSSNFSFYSDVGIDIKTWALVRGEWGILKSFSFEEVHPKLKNFGVLIGIGYARRSGTFKKDGSFDQGPPMFKGYVFIHL